MYGEATPSAGSDAKQYHGALQCAGRRGPRCDVQSGDFANAIRRGRGRGTALNHGTPSAWVSYGHDNAPPRRGGRITSLEPPMQRHIVRSKLMPVQAEGFILAASIMVSWSCVALVIPTLQHNMRLDHRRSGSPDAFRGPAKNSQRHITQTRRSEQHGEKKSASYTKASKLTWSKFSASISLITNCIPP